MRITVSVITTVPILTVCKFQTLYLSKVCRPQEMQKFLIPTSKSSHLKGRLRSRSPDQGLFPGPHWGQDVWIKPKLEKDS